MRRAVLLAQDAEDDLVDIWRYVAERHSVEQADQVLTRIERTCRELRRHPQRGHGPPELERVSVLDFREVHSKPYRIVYEVVGTTVHVHAILDRRRDLQELLARRLLR